MLIKKPLNIRSSEITDESVYLERRTFLKAATLAGIGMASSSAWGLVEPKGDLPKISPLHDSGMGQGLDLTAYKHVTSYNNFYEFGTSKKDPARNAHTLKTRPWTITIDGECEAPGQIGIEDILSGYTQEERIYRFRCVEAWSMVIPWVGFSLSELIKRAKPTSKAKYVLFETLVDKEQMPGQKRAVLRWPYREGLRMDEAMNPLAILATGLYGHEMPNQNGAPIRLVVPWKYGFKSIKSIVRISFVEKQPETTWRMAGPREYGFYANVNPTVPHPRWSQKRHRVIGAGLFASKEETQLFNGYADEVADLYKGLDLVKNI